jgi:hypothetical protein
LTTLVALAQTTSAAAEPPDTVVFSIGKTIVTLDAQYIKPPQPPGQVQTVVPMPFSCSNNTDYVGAEWFAQQGQTSRSEWKTFKCTHYDREITLSLRGTGSYDEIGFVDMWFDFELGFEENETTFWPECATSTVDGPSDPGDVPRWERLDTSVVGRCGNWQITAKITMLEGYSAHQP